MAWLPDDFQWDLGEPLDGDRALALTSTAMSGIKVALCITGGIAAFRCPGLIRQLRRNGADVHAITTPTALQFVTVDALAWTSTYAPLTALDGRAQHVENPPDIYLVAPASYSSINKFAHGIADNAVTTTLASALGHLQSGHSAIVLAPTMHGSMVNAILRESLAKLANLGVTVLPPLARDGKALLPSDEELVRAVIQASQTLKKKRQ